MSRHRRQLIRRHQRSARWLAAHAVRIPCLLVPWREFDSDYVRALLVRIKAGELDGHKVAAAHGYEFRLLRREPRRRDCGRVLGRAAGASK